MDKMIRLLIHRLRLQMINDAAAATNNNDENGAAMIWNCYDNEKWHYNLILLIIPSPLYLQQKAQEFVAYFLYYHEQ